MPDRYPSSADTHAMVARVAPAILELLGDGLPRSRHDIVAALAPHHAKDEVVRTLMRLAVTGRLVEAERKYRLAAAARAGPGLSRGTFGPLPARLSYQVGTGSRRSWRPARHRSRHAMTAAAVPKFQADMQETPCRPRGTRLKPPSVTLPVTRHPTAGARKGAFFGDPGRSGSHPSARRVIGHDPAEFPTMRIAGGQHLLLIAAPLPKAQGRLEVEPGSIS